MSDVPERDEPQLYAPAGLPLTSKTMRDRAAEAASPAMEKAKEMVDGVTERAQALQGDAKDRLASAQDRTTDMANKRKLRLPARPRTSGAGRQRRPAQSATHSGAGWMPSRTRQARLAGEYAGRRRRVGDVAVDGAAAAHFRLLLNRASALIPIDPSRLFAWLV
jgi:hypothetical protein